MNIEKDLAIGVFDSGVGGISVLAELVKSLPNEKFIYYGDSQNAPYGTRSTEEVKTLSFNVVDRLLEHGIKALVVACNTATSGAIEDLRQTFNIPIVGMEPALKPAVELNKKGIIIVMATPVTLREQKFNNLIKNFSNDVEVVKLPCPGLVEIIETKGGRGKEIQQYIKKAFSSIDMSKVSSIVLGCTHYIFIKEEIIDFIGDKDITLIDGNKGTANQLQRLLAQEKLLNPTESKGDTKVKMINSNNTMMPLSKKLFQEHLETIDFKGNIVYR
ncbi:MAG: glutamate racemase [Clostridiaceae bacterium]|nr:glutamate racemase [Clostridiaceae bacterium]